MTSWWKPVPTIQDKSKVPNSGMREYTSWLGGTMDRGCAPTDIDFMINVYRDGDSRFLFQEFKPQGSLGQTSVGQLKSLTGLASKPGITAVLIGEPHEFHKDQHTRQYPLDLWAEVVPVPPFLLDRQAWQQFCRNPPRMTLENLREAVYSYVVAGDVVPELDWRTCFTPPPPTAYQLWRAAHPSGG